MLFTLFVVSLGCETAPEDQEDAEVASGVDVGDAGGAEAEFVADAADFEPVRDPLTLPSCIELLGESPMPTGHTPGEEATI